MSSAFSAPQVTGVENAGPENEGHCRIWKMKDHDVSETKTIENCSAIGKLFVKSSTVVLGMPSYFITAVSKRPTVTVGVDEL